MSHEQNDPNENALEETFSDEFVRENIGWMLKLTSLILRNPTSAQDAVQIAFENVFKSRHKFEGRSSLKTWLHTITVNAALRLQQSERQADTVDIDTLQPTFDNNGCRLGEPSGALNSVESLANNEVTQRAIRTALDELSDDFRIVLILRDYEGYSTKETADALQISEQNVKVRLHRARAAMKKLLEPLLRDGGGDV